MKKSTKAMLMPNKDHYRRDRMHDYYDGDRMRDSNYTSDMPGHHPDHDIRGRDYATPHYANPYYRDGRSGRIGFEVAGEMSRLPNANQGYWPMDDRWNPHAMREQPLDWSGRNAEPHHLHPMDKETAIEWVKGMRNSDGSTGPHWTMEQTNQVLQQRGWNCKPAEFYAVINAMWSDYGKTAQKYGIDKTDYWADMAHDWLDDKDAKPDKAARYYRDIVER